MTQGPFWLDPTDDTAFPPLEHALRRPNGLLAVGGNLSPRRLIAAYRGGIFPWYEEGQPILWWSPDPRSVLFPERLKVSRSLRKSLNRRAFEVTLDAAFDAVVTGCAAPRADAAGTWITPDMQSAYQRLHRLGWAHSAETWVDDELVGGLYGVALGCVFFGESMFTRRTDASKVAFVHLVRKLTSWGFAVIDCQMHSEHLASLGAECIPRPEFIELLERWRDVPSRAPARWQLAASNAASQGTP